MATEDNIVASYFLDVASGNDSNAIGGGESCSLVNVNYATPLFTKDRSIGCNGVDAYGQISSADMTTIFGVNSGVTWAWAVPFRINTIPGGANDWIVARWNSSQNYWALLIQSDGKLLWAGGNVSLAGTKTLTAGKQYFAMMAHNTSDRAVTCWLAEEGDANTTQDASFTATSGLLGAQEQAFGARNGAVPSNHAHCDVGHFHLWKDGTVKAKADADFIWNGGNPLYWNGTAWVEGAFGQQGGVIPPVLDTIIGETGSGVISTIF